MPSYLAQVSFPLTRDTSDGEAGLMSQDAYDSSTRCQS